MILQELKEFNYRVIQPQKNGENLGAKNPGNLMPDYEKLQLMANQFDGIEVLCFRSPASRNPDRYKLEPTTEKAPQTAPGSTQMQPQKEIVYKELPRPENTVSVTKYLETEKDLQTVRIEKERMILELQQADEEIKSLRLQIKDLESELSEMQEETDLKAIAEPAVPTWVTDVIPVVMPAIGDMLSLGVDALKAYIEKRKQPAQVIEQHQNNQQHHGTNSEQYQQFEGYNQFNHGQF